MLQYENWIHDNFHREGAFLQRHPSSNVLAAHAHETVCHAIFFTLFVEVSHTLFLHKVYWGFKTAEEFDNKEHKCETLSTNRILQIVLWMLLGLIELLVCMSRVYVAAHFPHQVICGVISGGWAILHSYSHWHWHYPCWITQTNIIKQTLVSWCQVSL